MLVPASAAADGDPASDVLLGENVFYPYSPPISPRLQRTLSAETAAAGREHFPIKVALIASPADLGVVPDLFDQPQKYADFLDQEISFQTRQRLLVVMPSGYGVQGLSQPATVAAASLAKPTGSQSNDLARAAIPAVEALAAAAGHPIKTSESSSTASNTGGSSVFAPVALALAAIVLAATLLTLRRGERSFWTDRTRSHASGAHAAGRGSGVPDTFVYGLGRGTVQPRLVVGLMLIVGGALWAVARGLEFYGLTPAALGYDLDQPPVLLMLVGGWLLYRSGRG
jgi:hypothetical protein